MLKGLTFSHWLMLGGVMLFLLGLLLFWTLPMALGHPPFLITALLAFVYGAFEWVRIRLRSKSR